MEKFFDWLTKSVLGAFVLSLILVIVLLSFALHKEQEAHRITQELLAKYPVEIDLPDPNPVPDDGSGKSRRVPR